MNNALNKLRFMKLLGDESQDKENIFLIKSLRKKNTN